jgi:hypothetical protein
MTVMDYGERSQGRGGFLLPFAGSTTTRHYTDAENTGVPVVPLLAGRTTVDPGQDLDEQVRSHRSEV